MSPLSENDHSLSENEPPNENDPPNTNPFQKPSLYKTFRMIQDVEQNKWGRSKIDQSLEDLLFSDPETSGWINEAILCFIFMDSSM